MTRAEPSEGKHLSQGGYDYTYWSVALTLGFNEKPPLELEIRYWDSGDFSGFTCPPSGAGIAGSPIIPVSCEASPFPVPVIPVGSISPTLAA